MNNGRSARRLPIPYASTRNSGRRGRSGRCPRRRRPGWARLATSPPPTLPPLATHTPSTVEPTVRLCQRTCCDVGWLMVLAGLGPHPRHRTHPRGLGRRADWRNHTVKGKAGLTAGLVGGILLAGNRGVVAHEGSLGSHFHVAALSGSGRAPGGRARGVGRGAGDSRKAQAEVECNTGGER